MSTSFAWSWLGLAVVGYAPPHVNLALIDMARLEGTWTLVALRWSAGNGEDLDFIEYGKWGFANGHYITHGKERGESGIYRVDPSKSPKHLDLMPKIGGPDRSIWRCIYALDRDQLTLVFTVDWAPGSPEDELRTAKRARATRPKRFTVPRPRPGDVEAAVLVLTLKREKPRRAPD